MNLHISEEIEKLRREIEEHNYNYYVLARPVISDNEYDAIFSKLVELEKQYPQYASEASPTKKVGAIVIDEFRQVAHSVPMLSLDNTYNEEDITQFDSKVRKIIGGECGYCCELKIDGVSVALRYDKGILVKGISRGNGQIGEDITEHVRRIQSLPLKLKHEYDMEIRGEIYMPKQVFEKVNKTREEDGSEVFANPRNATAGTLRQLNTSVVRERGLRIFLYNLVDARSYGCDSQTESLKFLAECGLPVENHNEGNMNLDRVLKFWNEWNQKRHELPFDIDGVVCKVDNFNFQELLSSTSHSPRWAMAIKFPAEQKESLVENITLSVGRTGVITPVANISPVRLAGTVVKNASLHNFDNLYEKDIRINDFVIVEKAGDIIPQIVRSLPEKRSGNEKVVEIPAKCPVCGGETGKLSQDEVAVRCLNPLCEAKLKRTMEIFCSRQAMDIEGVGGKILDLLVDNKLISNLADIYYLKEEQLIPLPRLGQKSAKKIITQIAESKCRGLSNFLTGLGIPLVGHKTARDIASHFGNIERIISASQSELESVNGVGEEIALSVMKYFSQPSTKDMVKRFDSAGVKMFQDNELKSETLSGRKFVLTGTLVNYSRDEMKKIIESNGGIVVGSVSGKTDYVIAGENSGSKMDKAAQLNIKVLTEEEFFELLGN